jgi:membrane protein required for colicin V production
MAVIDYVIIAVVVISALVSFARGFLREALSLIAWTVAIIVAFKFAGEAAPFFGQWLADTTLQYWAAVVVLFLITLFACGVVNWLLSQFFSEFGTSGTDRSLGILLGGARGAVVVALLLLGGKVISLPLDQWGSEAKVYPHFAQFSEWLWQVGSDMTAGWGDSVGPSAGTEVAAEPTTGGTEVSVTETPAPADEPAGEAEATPNPPVAETSETPAS